MKPGSYKIPIEFETAGVHSALGIDSIKASVKGGDILVTAAYAVGGSRNPKHIELSRITPGTYQLKYLDPDGKVHLIAPVSLP